MGNTKGESQGRIDVLYEFWDWVGQPQRTLHPKKAEFEGRFVEEDPGLDGQKS